MEKCDKNEVFKENGIDSLLDYYGFVELINEEQNTLSSEESEKFLDDVIDDILT